MRNRKIALAAALMWLLAAGWIAVLFVLSGQDGVSSSRLSGYFTRLVMRWPLFAEMSPERLELMLRKLAHGGVFAVEGLLLGGAMMLSLRSRGCGAALSLGLCACMAVLNELHQRGSAGRSCELRDMIIDFTGAAVGIAAAYALGHVHRGRRRPPV